MKFYSTVAIFFVSSFILHGMELDFLYSGENEEGYITGESYLLQVLEKACVDHACDELPFSPLETSGVEAQIPYTLIAQLPISKSRKVTVIPEDFYRFDTANSVKFYCVFGACKESFTHKENLAEHMITHSKEDALECPYSFCTAQKKYRFRRTLLRHVWRHLDIRPYSCSHCSSRFIQECDLTYHARKKHGKKKVWFD